MFQQQRQRVQVCGEGEGVIGDAVVPLRSMFLEGADNVEVPGVFHSMSRVGTYDSPGGTAHDLGFRQDRLGMAGCREALRPAELSTHEKSVWCMTGHIPALLCRSVPACQKLEV